MIELLTYDGHSVGDTISIMVSEIDIVVERRGATSEVYTKSGRRIWVVESRGEVTQKVNAFLRSTHENSSQPG